MMHAIDAVQWMRIVPTSVRGDFAEAVLSPRSGEGTREYCRNPARERSFKEAPATRLAETVAPSARFGSQERLLDYCGFPSCLKKDG
jgi:hypothetical protein